MAPRRTKHEVPEAVPPSITPQVGIDLLKKQIERGKALLGARPLDTDRHSAWENTTREFLVKAFGSDSPNVRRVTEVGKFGSFPMNAPPEWWENQHAGDLKTQITMLESFVELLQTEIEISGP